MKTLLNSLCSITVFVFCSALAEPSGSLENVSIVPYPKYVEMGSSELVLPQASELYSATPEVFPLLELLCSEIQNKTGIKLDCSRKKTSQTSIVLKLDQSLDENEYTINVNNTIVASGGSYKALANAKSTLIQLIKLQDQSLCVPKLRLKDYPDAAYRGLMIDLARNWHETDSLKKLIDLAAYYKINYLQLHFTDDPSFTLPSKAYPELSTPGRHYSFETLKELEDYSQRRGVTIVPEIDVPGHSRQFTEKYPEVFAIKKHSSNPSIINMGKEEVYEAIDVLVGEVLSIFKSTPYFHIGGDEAVFTGVIEDPHVQQYVSQHNIGEDVHELFRHFICRMNRIVKSHGKQMCVWEGFGPDGAIEIPKDIIVFPFETNRYLPNELIEDGYTVVNVSWKPLYVVNEKKWAPKTIYDWNMWRWENWWNKAPSFHPIQSKKSNQVIGAQMCSWEQSQGSEIPSLRKRLPVMVERIWNAEYQCSLEELIERIEKSDECLSRLIADDSQDDQLFNYNFKR